MKKYEVTVRYTTYVTMEVEAENENEAVELSEGMEIEMGQVFDNLERYETTAEEID